VFDHEPDQTPERPLKLRAFEEIFDRGRGLPALVISGQLEAGGLRVDVGNHQSVLLVGSRGADADGPFALVLPQEHALGATHAVRVEAEARDRDESHAAVSYFELPGDRVAAREVSYAASWFSVFFDPSGRVDGAALSSPRSVAPQGKPS
jgi:hypothetical protein